MSSGHPGPGPVSSQPQLYDVSSGQGTNAAHSGYAGTVHVGSLADRLRAAASKGQTDKVKELYQAGARFEPDRVSLSLLLLGWLPSAGTAYAALINSLPEIF